jgi:hypothetical protein
MISLRENEIPVPPAEDAYASGINVVPKKD